jgi:hypothetical protein
MHNFYAIYFFNKIIIIKNLKINQVFPNFGVLKTYLAGFIFLATARILGGDSPHYMRKALQAGMPGGRSPGVPTMRLQRPKRR